MMTIPAARSSTSRGQPSRVGGARPSHLVTTGGQDGSQPCRPGRHERAEHQAEEPMLDGEGALADHRRHVADRLAAAEQVRRWRRSSVHDQAHERRSRNDTERRTEASGLCLRD